MTGDQKTAVWMTAIIIIGLLLVTIVITNAVANSYSKSWQLLIEGGYTQEVVETNVMKQVVWQKKKPTAEHP